MTSKESFKALVENVGSLSRKSQEELATDMGYGKTYISEVLSPTGKLSEKFVTAFKNFYKEYLENPNQALGKIGAVHMGQKKEAGADPLEIIANLTESNRMLAEANLILANKINSGASAAASLPAQESDVSARKDIEYLPLGKTKIPPYSGKKDKRKDTVKNVDK